MVNGWLMVTWLLGKSAIKTGDLMALFVGLGAPTSTQSWK